MATTALDIITGALRLINSYAPGESLSSADSGDALAVLNDMLDTWSTEHLTVFKNDEDTVTLTPGKVTYTIGAGGDINVTRPLRVTTVFTRITSSGSGGIDYPCEEASNDQYLSIGLKSQPGPWPKYFFYNSTYPLGVLYLWPVPTMAGELHIWADGVFTQFANLTDVVSLPQGYVRAMKKNLALELAVEYGKEPSRLLIEQARTSKAVIKALNSSPQSPATYDAAITQSAHADAGWILTGGF